MAYYLGLDAGGTATVCALAQNETVLARASGGSVKRMRASHEKASRHLDRVLRAVFDQSGVSPASIACACVGLSGIMVPYVAGWLREALEARVGGELILCGDESIALDAAFQGGPGVLAIAGTGSNVVARTAGGQMIRVGGWGPAVADEGSGAWIGKRAVRAVFDALDRGETAALWDGIQREWNLSDVDSLVDAANREPAPDFAALAPLAAACARNGDADAQRILKEAGEQLSADVRLALRRWRAADGMPLESPRLAYTGGILCHIPAVLETMRGSVLSEFPNIQINDRPVDAVLGALWRARQYCGSRSGGAASETAKPNPE